MAIPIENNLQSSSPPYPVLSTSGWLTGMYEKVDRIFSHYLIAQHSQTVYHVGHVKSCSKSIEQYSSTPHRLASKIKEDLEFLLKPYLDLVNVEVEYTERETGPEVDYKIKLEIVHAGYRWDQFKSIEVKDMKFREIVDYANSRGGSLV